MAQGLVQSLLSPDSQNVSLTWIIGLGLIVVFLFFRIRDPLRNIPGPFWARWTPWWNVYYARKGNMHRTMMAMHKKYGTLVRTAPNEVSTANPDALVMIYG